MNQKLNIQIIIEILEEYFSKEDLVGAGKHLENSLSKAREINDWQSELSILNEMIGYYRRVGKKEPALIAVNEAFEMIDNKSLTGQITAATIWLNGATTLKAFGTPEKGIPYFEKVEEVYREKLDPNDYKYASLFNNRALSHVDLEEYETAISYYEKAIEIMKFRKAYIELAVTYTNMAQMYERWTGDDDRISECLLIAKEFIDHPAIEKNGYYAFNCRKCAPTFGYYGFFLFQKELDERADRIYEGN